MRPNHADVKTTLQPHLNRELGKKVKFEITFCSAFGVIEKTVGFFESSDRQTDRLVLDNTKFYQRTMMMNHHLVHITVYKLGLDNKFNNV